MIDSVTHGQAWRLLERHYEEHKRTHLRDLFAANPERFEAFSINAGDLLFDFSKQRVTGQTIKLLLQLASEVDLQGRIEALFAGEPVNNTEGRPALHMALRQSADTVFPSAEMNVMPDVRGVLERMYAFSQRVRDGHWKGHSGKSIKAIVNIGIGGSDLGPAMVAHALEPYGSAQLSGHFVSNLDGGALARTLEPLDPETTLFVIASKMFSTLETLSNASSARRWLIDHYGTDEAVAKHFVAVSTQAERVSEFGIDTDNMFGFWGWVGGRYSVWSAIGLPLILLFGARVFEEFLAGAAEVDEHFLTQPHEANVPVLMGLIGVWNRNFLGAGNHAVLPYDFGLEKFPAYLQQLEMESNGKHVTRGGHDVDYETCPIIWGGLGNNGQHAYYQLLHQGTSLISSDFLVAANSQYATPDHQYAVLSNAFAQSQALMNGRTLEQASAQQSDIHRDDEEASLRASHRQMHGNQPSSTLLFDELTPKTLGSLMALYEHKVFVQSVCWDINAFDQWGVELGKELATVIQSQFESGTSSAAHDGSTRRLIESARARVRATDSGE